MSKPDQSAPVPERESLSLDEKLLAWTETSGQALELRVARMFRNHGAATVSSFAYVDPTCGGQREGDVRAEFVWAEPVQGGSALPASLVTVVECKSSKKQPWVAISPGREQVGHRAFDDWLVGAWSPYGDTLGRLAPLWILERPFDDVGPASHVRSALLETRRDRSSEKNNEKNEAGDAVRQVLAAAEAVWLRSKTRASEPGGEKRAVFVLAAIVTAAPLFRCELSRANEVQIREVNEFSVWGYVGNRRCRVYVMNEDQLPRFVEGLRYQALRASGDAID